MSNLINFVKSFSNQEDGQDLLEYALLVALIALIAIGAVTAGRRFGQRHLHGDRGLARRRCVRFGDTRPRAAGVTLAARGLPRPGSQVAPKRVIGTAHVSTTDLARSIQH